MPDDLKARHDFPANSWAILRIQRVFGLIADGICGGWLPRSVVGMSASTTGFSLAAPDNSGLVTSPAQGRLDAGPEAIGLSGACVAWSMRT